MTAEIVRKQTPEEREVEKKRFELAALEATLAQHELDLTTLRTELSVFEQEYMRVVGSRYAELDSIEAEIAAIQAKRNPADSDATQRATEARTRAEQSAREANAYQTQLPKPEFAPTDDIKKLYREIAKRVHPDLATDEADRTRRHAIMAEVNCAYAEGDIERLRTILEELEHASAFSSVSGIAAELIRLIRQIAQAEERIEYIAAEIVTLQQSHLYNLRQKAEKIKTTGRNLLNEMAEDVIRRITARRKVLTELNEEG